jgi:ADP-heptose:LPS heptosyltransferase
MSEFSRVAVLAHNGMGDVIMALPALAAVDRSLGPNARLLFVVCTPVEEQLVKLVQWRHPPEIVQTGFARGFKALGRLYGVTAAVRAFKPDLLLAIHGSQRLQAAVYARAMNARVAIGEKGRWSPIAFDKTVDWGLSEHKTSFYMKLPQAVGLARPDEPLVYPLVELPAPAERLAAPGERWIIFAPGSSPLQTHKRWPVEHFGALGRMLLDHGDDIRIGALGAKSETDLIHAVCAAVGDPARCRALVQSTIIGSLQAVGDAVCVVGGCTGTLHLTALMHRPIVGIYGASNPCESGPHAEAVQILRRGMACSPCYRVGFTAGCGNPVCVTGITPDVVFAAVLKALAGPIHSFPQGLACTMATAPSFE